MTHRAAQIRGKLSHPVIDGDGHWMEPIPVFLDYLAEVGGPKAVDEMRSGWRRNDVWYRSTARRAPAQPAAALHLVGRHRQYARQGDRVAARAAQRAPAGARASISR